MQENALMKEPDQVTTLAEIARDQRVTEGELRQCVGQFAQLLVAFKAEINELRQDIKGKVTISSAQARAIQEAVKARSREICEAKGFPYEQCGRALREALWREFHGEFTIGSRYDLPAFKFQSAIDFVQNWNSLSAVRRIRDKYGC